MSFEKNVRQLISKMQCNILPCGACANQNRTGRLLHTFTFKRAEAPKKQCYTTQILSPFVTFHKSGLVLQIRILSCWYYQIQRLNNSMFSAAMDPDLQDKPYLCKILWHSVWKYPKMSYLDFLVKNNGQQYLAVLTILRQNSVVAD